MADELIRRLKAEEAESDDLAAHLGPDAFHRPPPLHQATVAVVTTAGLHAPDQPAWQDQEQSFRVIDRRQRALRIGHRSANWDRSGFVDDVNVVLPLDRLEEYADEGVIGAVAPRHLSFMGAVRGTLATLRMDSGPAAATLLTDDDVDVVLLTPV